MKRGFVIVMISILLTGCGSAKRKTRQEERARELERLERLVERAPAPQPESVDETEEPTPPAAEPLDRVSAYIQEYAEIAKEEMLLYGIPASITLAQGILESGAGRGRLSREANNHFGIKCHDWKGAVIYHDDDEKGECFRKYNSPKFSFRDHSLFLTGRKRYTDLFNLAKDDYKGWAKGLRQAGYATDRKYPVKLISLIERYQLDKYDAEVLGRSKRVVSDLSDQMDQHTVQKGETLYSISRKYKLTVDQLMQYNGLTSSQINEGQVLYIKPSNTGY
ncbi:glucosaminidase domain-containing protein [Croceiramulus getboli]|nr:glucosaminidase domain-containing protein [Flavobacteriaceae bacterium YJPT1-3]